MDTSKKKRSLDLEDLKTPDVVAAKDIVESPSAKMKRVKTVTSDLNNKDMPSEEKMADLFVINLSDASSKEGQERG